MSKKTFQFEHRGKQFIARTFSRPFREGQEVTVELGTRTVRIAELGFGEQATIEKLKAELDKIWDEEGTL